VIADREETAGLARCIAHPRNRKIAMLRAVVLLVAALMLAPTLAHAKKDRGKRITLDLYQADITNVIRLLGDVSGKNVVLGDDVKGTVTLKLKNVPWRDAMRIILKLKGLGMEEQGGIIRVAPQARLDAERQAWLDQQDDWQRKAPLKTKLIPVNYARAAELVPHIKALLSERGTVTHDERTNVIIVRDVVGSPALSF
jgi:type IV pilus assembly protein PilQ